MEIPSRYTAQGTPICGGFGQATVYFDKHLERKVIIKEILDCSEIDRLLNEIKALQKSKSKNVVEIFDVIYDNDSDLVALVEEFLEGCDLINYKFVDSAEFIKVLYQLACGVSDLHDSNIVHRDLKPNNVKFDSEGLLKIFDFGLAKHDGLPTSTLANPGTLGFMAPELFLDPPLIDKAIDTYAFGVTAFYLAFGKIPPCCLETPPVCLPEGESISEYGDISETLAEVIDSCLNIDAATRPKMAEVKEALRCKMIKGKHKAVFVVSGQKYQLDNEHKGIKINRSKIDSAIIRYDGNSFKLSNPEGHVYVNEERIINDKVLVGSCVIILGPNSAGSSRSFVPFDVNHPEVVL